MMSTVGAVGATSASGLQMDYMKLLVTQMKNQDPLSPTDNTQMVSQMAQLSQLQQLETMNTSFSSVLNNEKMSYASSLIGKQVAFVNQSDGNTYAGTVEQVAKTDEGIMLRVVNGATNQKYDVNLDSVTGVANYGQQ
jgi:flagellar basal-body rod modification protein FlgD